MLTKWVHLGWIPEERVFLLKTPGELCLLSKEDGISLKEISNNKMNWEKLQVSREVRRCSASYTEHTFLIRHTADGLTHGQRIGQIIWNQGCMITIFPVNEASKRQQLFRVKVINNASLWVERSSGVGGKLVDVIHLTARASSPNTKAACYQVFPGTSCCHHLICRDKGAIY